MLVRDKGGNIMKQIYASDFRKNMKEYMDMAVEEPLIIDRRAAQNVVVLSLKDYKKLLSDEDREKLNQEIADVVEKKIEKVIRRLLTEYDEEKKKVHYTD